MRVPSLLVLLAVVGGLHPQVSTADVPAAPSITEVTPADTGPSIPQPPINKEPAPSIIEVTPAKTLPSPPQTLASNHPAPSETDDGKLSTHSGKQVTPDGSISGPEEPKIINDHTITANDFAKIAAVAIAEKNKAEDIKSEHSTSEGSLKDPSAAVESGEQLAIESQPKPQVVIQPAVEIPGKPTNSLEATGQLKFDEGKTDVGSILKVGSGDKEDVLLKHSEKVDSNSNSEIPIPSSSTESPEIKDNLLPFKDLADKLSDEVKVHSNNAMLEWEPRKDKVSWISAASNVLKDYIEKIHSTEKGNAKECVKEDLKKYEERKKILAQVMKQCESSLKREDFKELQDTTKQTLQAIDFIVNEALVSIDKLSKTDGSFESEKSVIEIDAKNKLRKLNIESITEKLKKLKDSSLRKDEVEYKNCIEGRPEKSMIEETRAAIKNMCVG